MSQPETPDPYASPTADIAAGSKPLDVMAAFRFPFQNDGWIGNLFLVLLCMLIPIVGPIVFLGYKFELIEWLLKQPKRSDGAGHPSLDFGRFGDYLKRGVWPFLAALIAQLVMTPLVMLIIFPLICGVGLAGAMIEENDMEAVGVMCMIATQVLMFVGILAINLLAITVVTPMMIGAGLSQELGPAIDFQFIKGFISRTWKEMLAAYLWLFLASFVLMPLGLCLLIVGAYLVGAWAWLAMAHLYYQLYLLYLERGGTPIKPKSDKPQPTL